MHIANSLAEYLVSWLAMRRGDDKRLYFIYKLSRNTYKHQYDWNLVDFRIAQPIAIGSPDFLSYARTQGYATQADLIELRKSEEVRLKNVEIALAVEGRPICGASVFLGWSTGKIVDERVQIRPENGSIQYFPVPYVYICDRR